MGPRVEAVHGNADDAAVRAALPRETTVTLGGVRIGIVHVPGPRLGRAARLLARFPDCQAVVYGHTHVPQLESHRGVWLLNPGSPTERRRAPSHSMLMLAVTRNSIEPELVALRKA